MQHKTVDGIVGSVDISSTHLWRGGYSFNSMQLHIAQMPSTSYHKPQTTTVCKTVFLLLRWYKVKVLAWSGFILGYLREAVNYRKISSIIQKICSAKIPKIDCCSSQVRIYLNCLRWIEDNTIKIETVQMLLFKKLPFKQKQKTCTRNKELEKLMRHSVILYFLILFRVCRCITLESEFLVQKYISCICRKK